MAKADILAVFGTGNLTRAPELKNGIAKLRIASNSRVKQGEEWGDHTNYLDLTLFGKPAEWASDDLDKGDHVAFNGRLKYREWQDGEGKTRSAYEVLVDNLDYARKAPGTPQSNPDKLPY